MSKYIPPTEEEIASVLEFWGTVQKSVIAGKKFMSEVPPKELLNRVRDYQERQSALLCNHPEISTGFGVDLTCTHCDRPLKFLSDIQIEELK